MISDVERDLLPLLIQPNKRLTSITVKVKGSLEELIGLLKRLHVALSNHNNSYVLDAKGHGGMCHLQLYVEDLNELALRELSQALSGSHVELRVNEGPYEGMCFSPRRGELLAAGMPVMIFSRSLMLDLIRELKRRWGSAAESFLYYFGYGGGVETYKRWRRLLSWLDDRELLDAVCRVTQAFGWYAGYEILDFDRARGEARINIFDLFECLDAGRGSAFYRGILAGWFAACLGGDVDVVEERCLMRGDRFCRFYVRLRGTSKSSATF